MALYLLLAGLIIVAVPLLLERARGAPGGTPPLAGA